MRVLDTGWEYLFTRIRENLWLLPMKTGFFEAPRKPIQISNGPLSYSRPSPSRDGKHVFAIGMKRRGELVHYDMNAKTVCVVPFRNFSNQPQFLARWSVGRLYVLSRSHAIG